MRPKGCSFERAEDVIRLGLTRVAIRKSENSHLSSLGQLRQTVVQVLLVARFVSYNAMTITLIVSDIIAVQLRL